MIRYYIKHTGLYCSALKYALTAPSISELAMRAAA